MTKIRAGQINSEDALAGYVLAANGTGSASWESVESGSHDEVTLSTGVAVLLDLNDQELLLVDQSATNVFAGPTSGSPAQPTFRKLVAADVGTGTPVGTKFLRDDMSWQAPPSSTGTVTGATDILMVQVFS